MNAVEPSAPISPVVLKQALQSHFFPDAQDTALKTYAVLDGASIPDLLDHMYADPRPEFICLYRGELEPDMAEVAPYLVRLNSESPFTNWLLAEGWGKHWGIFAISLADLAAMRRHFRTFLMVKNPERKQVYFRYYDPRVLRTFLPTCNAEETEIIFGRVRNYLCEAEQPGTLLTFSVEGGLPRRRTVKLATN